MGREGYCACVSLPERNCQAFPGRVKPPCLSNYLPLYYLDYVVGEANVMRSPRIVGGRGWIPREKSLNEKENWTLGVTALQECTATCGFARCEVGYALSAVAVQQYVNLVVSQG